MAAFDPYAVLGVTADATGAAIKAAYRRRVQVAHPDRGGDPAAFILVARAFGVLSDPEARRLYDSAGIIDEAGLRHFRRDVAAILADMFDAAVGSATATALPLARIDFIAQLGVAVGIGEREAKTELEKLGAEIADLERLALRIRRSAAGDNLFSMRLGERVAERRTAEVQLRRRLALLQAARVELGLYRSDVELIAALSTEG